MKTGVGKVVAALAMTVALLPRIAAEVRAKESGFSAVRRDDLSAADIRR